MNQPLPLPTIDEVFADYSAGAARSGPLLPLASLLVRLREPLRDAAFWAGLGNAMLRNGFADPAAAMLAAALAHYPDDIQLRYLRGNALRVAQRLDEAERELRGALARAPGHRQAALSLAFMLREQGRIDAAGDLVLAQWRADHGSADGTLELLEFLRGSGAQRQARALAADAHAAWPGHARIAAIAGELDLAFGEFATAQILLREAIQRDPAQSSAWLRLSYCRRCEDANDADLGLLRSGWEDPHLAAPSRICAGFGLGKFLDDLDDCAQASAVLRTANALALAQSAWRPDTWRALLDAQIARPPLPALDPPAGFTPLFIVGLPRTGTTLVATRLAGHADVHDRGELNWIGAMYEHLAGQNALGDRAALQSVAALVAAQMRRDDAPARCYIDKNPLNFRYLNLILALFPTARIVHCRRNRRDTGLSLWSQHFAHPDLAFSYSFDAIAQVARDEQRYIAHWRATLGAPILDVDYESLVTDPQPQLARIAAFAGLADGAAVEGASISEVITTASVWQARQPIHSRAIGRWQRYAQYIPELARIEDGRG
jgi:tetratricopeptide (TPR) repeat protein